MEETVQDVSQEFVAPEHVETEVPEQEQESNTEPVEDAQEKNWRETRQALKELKRENQALRQHVEQMATPKSTPPEDDEDDGDIVTEKQLNKRIRELEGKIRKGEEEVVLERLQSKFPDFNDVVSEENIAYLKQHDPEIAESLNSLNGDPYKMGMAVYKTLKKTDYYQNRNAMEDKAKVADNQKKPVSVSAVRKQGALAEANKFANGLTPELKKSLWKEMQEARKRS